ncbi:MAG: tetratricopeptide repeat protein [Anaerolineales bacterium]
MDEMLTPEVSPEEMMFHQAVEFIEQGDFANARDILTRLLKTDQNNALYWVWLSAAMETHKERLYCLQTALRLDPENAAARRGLTLMGALPPDEGLTPFSMAHPRPWAAKTQLPDDVDRPRGLKALAMNPVARVVALIVLGVGLIGGVIAGFSASGAFDPAPTRPVFPTFTPLPTATIDMTREIEERGPLAGLISATYTPTVVYAATPYDGVARDTYRGALRAYERGDWNMVAEMMFQVATIVPGSADTLYFAAEAYRFDGRYQDALRYYQEAISINPNFAPAYLGQARANLAINPNRAIIADLNTAINLDPEFGEAYLERGYHFLRQRNNQAAMEDLRQASELMPESPLVYIALARAELLQENFEEALAAAQRANELDVVMLEGYLVLGMAYRANGETDKALEALEIYTLYSQDSSEAFAFLGATYFNRGEYDKALTALDQALSMTRTNAEAYYWRGETHLALEDTTRAIQDFRSALVYRPNYFEAGMGIVRAFYAQESYNNGYIELLNIEGAIKSDTDRAVYLYHRAIGLGELGFPRESQRDWEALLALPEEVTTEEIRQLAEERIEFYRLLTPSPTVATPSATPTPTATRTPTSTPTPTSTRMPTNTPAP